MSWLDWPHAFPPALGSVVAWDPYRQQCVPDEQVPSHDPYARIRVTQIFQNRWTGTIKLQGIVMPDASETS